MVQTLYFDRSLLFHCAFYPVPLRPSHSAGDNPDRTSYPPNRDGHATGFSTQTQYLFRKTGWPFFNHDLTDAAVLFSRFVCRVFVGIIAYREFRMIFQRRIPFRLVGKGVSCFQPLCDSSNIIRTSGGALQSFLNECAPIKVGSKSSGRIHSLINIYPASDFHVFPQSMTLRIKR